MRQVQCLTALGLLMGGTAGVVAGTAAADPVADKSRTVETDTGWRLAVNKTSETLDRVPNLAATMFTREGFVAVKAVAEVTGTGRQTVKPGGITTIEFGTKPLAGPRASITVDQVQVKVNACMGPVSLRSFATARITTPEADNTVTVYGDPIYL
ncbi:MspA family porin [Nocardia sp. NPDC057030]|uniref:MspA family porin n=1 Tax=unclassified Nocardia TaxID=2637762 RepID=UPI0036253394